MPDKVVLNETHSKIMDGLLECGFYVSTCIYETFGISAFEAINRGLPVLYFTQKDGKLGHDEFCNRSNSRKTMKSNRQAIADAYKLFKNYSTQQRWDIAGELYETYNLNVFKAKIDAFADEALDAFATAALSTKLKEPPRSELELFF